MATTGLLPLQMSYGDTNGNAVPSLVDLSPHRMVLPTWKRDVDGYWYTIFTVPQDYVSTGQIVMRIGANATSGVTRLGVSSYLTSADGSSYDGTYTTETAQDITVPGTAYNRKDVTFTLTPTLAAGNDVNLRLEHLGAHANDTLSAETVLFRAFFKYTGT